MFIQVYNYEYTKNIFNGYSIYPRKQKYKIIRTYKRKHFTNKVNNKYTNTYKKKKDSRQNYIQKKKIIYIDAFQIYTLCN